MVWALLAVPADAVWKVNLDLPNAISTLKNRLSAESKPREIEFTGFYRGATVEFGPEVSGIKLSGAHSMFSGGRRVTGWRESTFLGKKVWGAKVNFPVGSQLFWKDTRLVRPRLPSNGGFYQFNSYLGDDGKSEWNVGHSGMTYKGDDLKPWRNLDEVEIICHHLWITSRLPIKSLDLDKKIVQFTKKGTFKLVDDHTGQPGFYRVENVAEALAKPGEFYYDSQSKTLYVVPIPGTNPASFAPTTGGVPTIFRLKGARDTKLSSLTFAHTEYNYGPNQSGDPQAAVSVPSAVELVDCKNVELTNCTVTQVGNYAVTITGASEGNKLRGCTFTDLGAGGVKIDHGTSRTTVAYCRIQGGGRIHAPAVGIWVGNSSNNKLVHNTITDLFYTGISVGWTWGYAKHDGQNNLIEGNIISKIGQGELSDMGGIYHLGVAPGTVIRGNTITDVRSRGYGGWGIYLDEGSSDIIVERNTVKHTKSGGFHQHYGRDNQIRNNIFAFAERDGLVIRSREEDHTSFVFENNIVVSNGSPIIGGNWSNGKYVFRNNVLWAGGKELPLPPGATGNRWQDPGIK